MIIKVDPSIHASWDEMSSQVDDWHGGRRDVITDPAALRIASEWSRLHLMQPILSVLASTGEGDHQEIIDVAEKFRGLALSGAQDEQMCALIGWAEHKSANPS